MRSSDRMAKPVIVIDEINRVVTTTFEDGAVLHAKPNTDEESKARAVSLGYNKQGDHNYIRVSAGLWAMTKDHERLHHMLAEARNVEISMALYYAAHPAETPSPDQQAFMHDEERIVLLIQRLLNHGLDQ